jgi:hypothetical protein
MNDVPVPKPADPMAIGAIIALAHEVGATWVENMGRDLRGRSEEGMTGVESRQGRVLCALLRNHVFEQQYALGRTAQQRAARIKAISTAQSIAIMVRNVRARKADPERERLAIWLGTERTKLLMASKADAIGNLDSELHKVRRQLPDAATAAVRTVSLAVLEPFYERASGETAKPLAAFAKRLVVELEETLADLGEVLSRDAMLGIEPPSDVLIERAEILPVRAVGSLAARLGLVSRRRIEEASRFALINDLELGSIRAMMLALEAYDDILKRIHRQFCEGVEGLLESVERATEFAEEAQRDGRDGITRARRQVADWLTRLSETVSHLD